MASPLTVRRLLTRLPAPERASLEQLGHAAAMSARGRLAAPTTDLTAALDDLHAWQTQADQKWNT